jgi:16S rRNA A1518/A1519 N6-dimethyltransferase RsmA/KsgA/DIM1 with predicted DNA glycosylase/AP lyase activity
MDASLIEAILDVEDHHRWFRGRRKIVARVRGSRIGDCRGRVLEIGCGSGANFKILEEFGEMSAIELDHASREAANHREITKVICSNDQFSCYFIQSSNLGASMPQVQASQK